jgi:hypothetical protein
MNLAEYFEKTSGFGVLATSDKQGRVDAAVYARPHVIDEKTVAFIMRQRVTHHNLRSNPHAAYLFREGSEGYHGKRLYLQMIREESNQTLIAELSRHEKHISPPGDDSQKYLVYFEIQQIRPLIGDEMIDE